MYFSGTPYNFQNRLHQLPTGFADVDNFVSEGLNYTGIYSGVKNLILNNEVKKRYFVTTQNTGYLTGEYLI